MNRTWGREESEWELLQEETATFLAEQARLGRLTTYTELNAVLHERTDAPAFDFARDRDRAAMGDLLGQVARHHLPEIGALLSAIVIYLNENDAGPGFYRLAAELGLLQSASSSTAKLGFWTKQVAKVHAHYAGGSDSIAADVLALDP